MKEIEVAVAEKELKKKKTLSIFPFSRTRPLQKYTNECESLVIPPLTHESSAYTCDIICISLVFMHVSVLYALLYAFIIQTQKKPNFSFYHFPSEISLTFSIVNINSSVIQHMVCNSVCSRTAIHLKSHSKCTNTNI